VAVTDIDLDGTSRRPRQCGAWLQEQRLPGRHHRHTAVKTMGRKVVAEYGVIDILCNVAGAILHKMASDREPDAAVGRSSSS